MSYSATISFKHLNLSELFEFIKSFKTVILNNLDDIAKNEYYYCPLVRANLVNYETLFDLKIVRKDLYYESEAWFQRLFSYRWFYVKDWKLLGVYSVPKCAYSLFDGTVYFQNCCDQDYEKSDYDGIDLCENIWDKWNNEIDEVIVDKLKCNGYKDEDILHTSESLDYYRRSFAYEEIWSYIEPSLYNENIVTYLSLFGFCDIFYKERFLENCFRYGVAYFKGDYDEQM